MGAAAGLDPGRAPDGTAIPALSPCGLAARDSLRLEAGMPLYGHELSEGITPFDASLGSVVGLDKPEFVGREALVERAGRRGAEGTTEPAVLPLLEDGLARHEYPAFGPTLGFCAYSNRAFAFKIFARFIVETSA